MARKLEIEIVGNTSDVERAFGKVGKDAGGLQGVLGKAGRGIATVGKIAGGVALGGLAALGAAAKVGFDEFSEGQRVSAQTGAVLKSTGGAANVTAKQIEALAGSLSRMSGVDDEAIQSGQNMLLTFTNVRNEVGKGRDIFNQATQATLDLSVAMGKDMQGSAILVGKALNDPVKGMSALSKAGIQFTAAQKESIVAMVESGNAMGAQKMILKELETQFGGSAKAAGETLPGQLDKAKNALSGLAGEMVAGVLPPLASLATTVATSVVPRLLELAGALVDKVTPSAKAAADFISTNWPKIKEQFIAVATFVRDTFGPIFVRLRDIVREAVTKIAEKVQEHVPEIRTIFSNLSTIVRNLAAVVVPLLDVAFTKVLPLAISILIPALVAVSTTIAKVSSAIRFVIEKCRDLVDWINANKGTIGAAFQRAFAPVIAVFETLASIIGRVVSGIQWLIDNIGRIPDINIPGIGNIPGFQTGGIFRAPKVGGAGLAILHDRERVIPAGRARHMGGGTMALATMSGGSRGHAPINVYVAGNVVTERELIEAVRLGISRYRVRNGRDPL